MSINEYDTSPIILNENVDPNAKHLAKNNSNEFIETRGYINKYLPKSINSITNSRIKSLQSIKEKAENNEYFTIE